MACTTPAATVLVRVSARATLSPYPTNGHEVVVVNAGSNTVSAFHVRHDRLELQSAPVGPDRTEVRATLLVKD